MISVRKLAKAGGILFWVILAIVTALVVGSIKVGSSPLITVPLARVFVTFSAIFAQFLSFAIPLIIVGLVTPAIADLGRGAGKWLSITAALAYGSTLFSGFLTYVVCASVFPHIITKSLASNVGKADAGTLKSYFEVEMPPVFGVMTALLLSFVIGIGLSLVPRGVLRKASIEFRAIISALINKIIIPLLPLHVFGTFLNLAISGAAWRIMRTLLSVVVVVLVLEVVILLTQFVVAGLIGKRNPVKGAVDHDARLHHCSGYLLLGGHHPGDFASDPQKWGICAGSCFHRASVRHYSPGWFNLENYRLFTGHYCLSGHECFSYAVCRFHFHAGYCHGGRPGCARRCDYGRYRGALFNAGL